ncbi:hypothetical protein ACFP1C_13215 [Levilactobacillus fujinensis]|uniref:Uncharacterized protein n=1 Tax=Levilactobacillus fujinensis TaxID=2486024 RepID=A0ABW1TJ50_9LACO
MTAEIFTAKLGVVVTLWLPGSRGNAAGQRTGSPESRQDHVFSKQIKPRPPINMNIVDTARNVL